MKCPKCKFEQPEDIFCANCGVEVSTFQNRQSQQKRTFAVFGITAAAIALVVVILALLFFSEDAPDHVAEPLTADDSIDSRVPVPPEDSPGHDVGKPALDDAAADDMEPEHPVFDTTTSKPVPPMLMEATLDRREGLVKIPIGSLGVERDSFRVAVIKNGRTRDVVFQIDSGWNVDENRTLRREDVLLVRAADVGDQDNHAAAPGSAEKAWIVEVGSAEQGKGWFYIYSSYNPRSEAEGEFVHFTDRPEEASSDSYAVAFDSQNLSHLNHLDIAGFELLDRMKIRVSTEQYVVDETAMTLEPDVSISGPLVARSRKKGSLSIDNSEVAIVRQSAYYPDRFDVSYSFDFPAQGIPGGILRVYFDLSEQTRGLRIITADSQEGEVVDGEGVPGEHRGKWFMLTGSDKVLRVTMTKGAGKLVVMDDASVEDPPESERGCMGCPGFEFINVRGRMEFTLNFEILEWTSADGAPPAKTSFKTIIMSFK